MLGRLRRRRCRCHRQSVFCLFYLFIHTYEDAYARMYVFVHTGYIMLMSKTVNMTVNVRRGV